MGYAELIHNLEQLPEDKQAEVFDFAEFLVRRVQKQEAKPKTLAESSMARWIREPVGVAGFTPLSREEANAR